MVIFLCWEFFSWFLSFSDQSREFASKMQPRQHKPRQVLIMCTFKAQKLKKFNILQENSKSKNKNHEDAGVQETKRYHTTQLEICSYGNFFLCVLFITFSYSKQLCTYDCIGTSGKKSPINPCERVFVNKTTAEVMNSFGTRLRLRAHTKGQG